MNIQGIEIQDMTEATRAIWLAGWWRGTAQEAAERSGDHKTARNRLFWVGVSFAAMALIFWSVWPLISAPMFMVFALNEDIDFRVFRDLGESWSDRADQLIQEHARLTVESAIAEHISQRAIGGVQ